MKRYKIAAAWRQHLKKNRVRVSTGIADVFGTLRNPAYLDDLKVRKKVQEEYRRLREEAFGRNYKKYYSGGGGGSSYSVASSSNYNEDEKKMLREIYRMASKKFHPDVSGDDGSKMKLLTKLKDQWGL